MRTSIFFKTIILLLASSFISTFSSAYALENEKFQERSQEKFQQKTQVIHVAIASDFLNTFQQINKKFTSKTPYRIIISSGATNTLFMQIQHGAPYDIFFSADSAHPDLLIQSGQAIPHPNFVYAIGQLVLWAPHQTIAHTGKKYLISKQYNHLAIANPKLAPYGLAAMETLQCLKLETHLAPKIIRGENVNQAFNFVATKNADAGLVAFAQVLHFKKQIKKQNGQRLTDDVWKVPITCYKPIQQKVVILKKGAQKSVAVELLNFFKQPKIQELIKQAGYEKGLSK